MRTESVAVTEVGLGDVVADPAGTGLWRRVRELRHGRAPRRDGSGREWTYYAFVGPLVDPAAAAEVIGNQPRIDRFVFREDESVTRTVAETDVAGSGFREDTRGTE
ncbi:hypothetical protein [Nocardia harenae]|uniref:hypothetical protein n=1 Tax=Nocardia harenae TaxID=358707 RepID=UPI000B08A9F6|nr:hypothetical protein [Nocardia harenae]